jgi:hypothetical protein
VDAARRKAAAVEAVLVYSRRDCCRCSFLDCGSY